MSDLTQEQCPCSVVDSPEKMCGMCWTSNRHDVDHCENCEGTGPLTQPQCDAILAERDKRLRRECRGCFGRKTVRLLGSIATDPVPCQFCHGKGWVPNVTVEGLITEMFRYKAAGNALSMTRFFERLRYTLHRITPWPTPEQVLLAASRAAFEETRPRDEAQDGRG